MPVSIKIHTDRCESHRLESLPLSGRRDLPALTYRNNSVGINLIIDVFHFHRQVLLHFNMILRR